MNMEYRTLSDISEIIAGQSPPSIGYNIVGNGIPFFQGKADFGYWFPKTRIWCDNPKKISLPNDILISVRAPVGPTNINITKACIGRGLSAIRCKPEKLYYRFLIHYLRWFEPQLTNKATGSTFMAITQRTLKNLQIPLPPLSTQKKIADLLDTADALHQKTQAIIDHYDQLAQSLFLEMFGDPVRNPMGWEEKKIQDISKIITKGESPKWQGYTYIDKGVRFITSENVRLGYINCNKDKFIAEEFHEKLKRSKLKLNDLLVNLVGASIGRGALVTDKVLPANINQAVAKIELNLELTNPIFILAQIISPQLQERLIGNKVEGARANISLKNVRELKVYSPPLPLQNQFASRIALIERQKELAKKSLEESENLFNALLQKAFKGEIEVNEAEEVAN